MTRQPLVSVYLPTCNRESLVPRAIESVLRQDHRELELLVVDDASADGTPGVLARIAAADARVRLFRQPSRGGAPACATSHFAPRGAASSPASTTTTRCCRTASRRCCRHSTSSTRSSAAARCCIRAPGSARPGSPICVITLDEELYGDQAGTQVLTLTSRIVEAGLFDESMPAWQDYDLWTRLIERDGLGPADRRAHVPAARRGGHAAHHRARSRGRKALHRQAPVAHAARHLASQELELYMLERRRLGLGAAAKFVTPRTWRPALRYAATSSTPALRLLAEHYRRWRWSPRRTAARLPPR